MRKELEFLLKSYLLGWRPLLDCYLWISGVSWDDPELGQDSELSEALGCLELLSTEASEGIRPEQEFQEKAAEILASWTNTVYGYYGPPREPRIFVCSGDERVFNLSLTPTSSMVLSSSSI